MHADGISTNIEAHERPHIKEVMKYALSDFFKKHQELTRMEKNMITQHMAAAFFDPYEKKLPDDKLAALFKTRAKKW